MPLASTQRLDPSTLGNGLAIVPNNTADPIVVRGNSYQG